MRVDPFRSLIEEFTAWLDKFEPQHRRNWENLLHADDEAALSEAMTWLILVEQGVQVQPNADLKGEVRRPDFRCTKNGRPFHVEATCIRKETLEAQTGLASSGKRSFTAIKWQGFLRAVFSEVTSKTPQCANSDAPCLLAIGTFHGPAGMGFIKKKFVVAQLLTGEATIAWDVDFYYGGVYRFPENYVNHSVRAVRGEMMKPAADQQTAS